ncbi:hypothetical protein [Streptomyces sp. NPDC046712]|uniref:hypothetical protein n=1 Tax=Streptomyces sp. NPDC046712 TaxID=3154802 RepID=UPI0034117403
MPAAPVVAGTEPVDDTNLTPPGQFNIHVGARPDFPNQPAGVEDRFRGTLDDVRLCTTALTTDEAVAVKNGALDVATDKEKLRLGFSTIW